MTQLKPLANHTRNVHEVTYVVNNKNNNNNKNNYNNNANKNFILGMNKLKHKSNESNNEKEN